MAIDAESYLISFGTIILIAFLAYVLFQRTRVPDVVLLIGLGVVLGPLLTMFGFRPLFDPSLMAAVMPLLAAVAIIVILFDGGLKINVRNLFVGAAPAALLAFAGFLASALLVAGILRTFGFVPDIWVGLTLGAILGGTSSVIVMPLADSMRMEPRTRTIAGVESAITDVMVIVGAISLAIALQAAEATPEGVAQAFVTQLAVGLALGIMGGFVWSHYLRKFTRRSYEYMLTIALLFLFYAFSEFLGGSGPMSVLAFGLIVGNSKRMDRLHGPKLERAIEGHERRYELAPVFNVDLVNLHSEIVFFVRAFFFVAIGTAFDIAALGRPGFLLTALLILLALLAARGWAVALSLWRTRLSMRDKAAVFSLMPRGLAAAAMAGIPFAVYGIEAARDFVSYVVLIILLTNVATAVSVSMLESDRLQARWAAYWAYRREARVASAERHAQEKTAREVGRLSTRQQRREARAASRVSRRQERKEAKTASRELRQQELDRRKMARLAQKDQPADEESKGPWG